MFGSKNKIYNLKSNGYPEVFVNRVINSQSKKLKKLNILFQKNFKFY